MKKLATRLTPPIKALIKEVWGSDCYDNDCGLFHFPNYKDYQGFSPTWHVNHIPMVGYTEVSEAEFLAEFGKPKVEYQMFMNGIWYDLYYPIRIKPIPDYSPEIEALQAKAKENGMTVTINFEKL